MSEFLARQRRNLGVLLAAVLLTLFAGAAPALAHAELATTTPTTGSSVDELGSFTLTFTEPVTILPSAIRVLDADGAPMAVGAPYAEGSSIIVPTTDLPEGGYVVSWRVVSLDGHPIDGSFTFGLGVPALAGSAAVAADAASSSPARSLAVGIEIFAALLLAGAWLSRRVVVREDAHRATALAIAVGAARVGIVATLVLLPVRMATLLGIGLTEVRPGDLGAFLDTTVGRGTVLRLAAFGSFLLLARLGKRVGASSVMAVAAAAAAGSFAFDGHTRTVDSFAIGTGADLVHLAAGAAWLGGLVVLARVLRKATRPDAVEVARIVSRFSAVATVAVIAVTAAGSILADAILPSGILLGGSAYSTALLAKTFLVAVLVAVGAYNHVALVPAVQRAAHPMLAGGSTDTMPRTVALRWRRGVVAADAASRSLRRTLRVEAGLFVAVIAVTGGLVDLSPPAPVTATSVTAYLDLGGGLSAKFDATVDARGVEAVAVRLINPVGQPGRADALTLFASNEALGLTASPVEMVAAGPGMWTFDGEVLSLPGAWQIDVVARTSRFAEESTAVLVTVE